MCSKIFLTALTIGFCTTLNKSKEEIHHQVWNYDDQSNWPGNVCRHGGKRQSPINIRTSQVITDYKRDFIKNGPLQFIGYKSVLATGINNGYTVQFSTEGGSEMHPTLMGGPLAQKYRLEQLHFHWLSEHAIDGNKYPMEIHFVHVRADLSVPEALTENDGLAIVAMFCNVKSSLTNNQWIAAEEVMQYIPKLLQTGDRISGVLLDTTKLLTPNRMSYFTYEGSLTSPGCNEAVIWIIFDSPVYISDTQYRLLGKVGVGRHNFRSLQKLSHHVVFRPDTSSSSHASHITKVFNDFFGLVTDMFKNATNFVANGFKGMR